MTLGATGTLSHPSSGLAGQATGRQGPGPVVPFSPFGWEGHSAHGVRVSYRTGTTIYESMLPGTAKYVSSAAGPPGYHFLGDSKDPVKSVYK